MHRAEEIGGLAPNYSLNRIFKYLILPPTLPIEEKRRFSKPLCILPLFIASTVNSTKRYDKSKQDDISKIRDVFNPLSLRLSITNKILPFLCSSFPSDPNHCSNFHPVLMKSSSQIFFEALHTCIWNWHKFSKHFSPNPSLLNVPYSCHAFWKSHLPQSSKTVQSITITKYLVYSSVVLVLKASTLYIAN